MFVYNGKTTYSCRFNYCNMLIYSYILIKIILFQNFNFISVLSENFVSEIYKYIVMKQFLFVLVLLLSLQSNVQAGNDKPIKFEQLPATAKEMINTHFSGVQLSFAKEESEIFDKSYEIIFVNGNKIEFDKNGNWKEIDCKYTEVPESVIPSVILNHVRNTYGGVRIVSIEKYKKGYEVELANGLELKFNKQFELIDIDN